MTEEKMGGAKLGAGVASSPHRAKSPSVKVRLALLLLPVYWALSLNGDVTNLPSRRHLQHHQKLSEHIFVFFK